MPYEKYVHDKSTERTLEEKRKYMKKRMEELEKPHPLSIEATRLHIQNSENLKDLNTGLHP